MFKIIALLLASLSFSALANTNLPGKRFLFQYEGGQHYKVEFSATTVTWTGVKGADAGKTETDDYIAEYTNGIYRVLWQENDETVVSLNLDLVNKKVKAAIQFNHRITVISGVVTVLPSSPR